MLNRLLSFTTNNIYNIFFTPKNPISTYYAYEKILERFEDNSTILDIGVGNGIYFSNPNVKKLITEKKLKIHGIDIDTGIIKHCKETIVKNGLEDYVTCDAIDLLNIKETYDYSIFMESYPVINSELFYKLLNHAMKISNKTFLYNNLQELDNRVLRFIKPKLKYLTSVDFGKLTTISEFKSEMNLHKISNKIELLLSCRFCDMHPFLKYCPIKYKVTQYLIEI